MHWHAQGKLFIITGYASNGNLHSYLNRQASKLPEALIWKLFIQVRPARARLEGRGAERVRGGRKGGR
jgi:hypothetical protein